MRRDLSQLIDAAVVLLVGAVAIVGAAVRAEGANRPLAIALAVGASASLVVRRRVPVLTLALSGGLVLALFALDRAAGTIAVVAPAAALYSLALVRGRGHILAGALAAAAAVIVADVFLAGGHTHTLTLQTLGHAALVAVPVLAAEALRNHRSYVRLLLERLELAERTREEEARRRADQERLRIARDLHDVLAHTLTTINVQAGVANHLLERKPENAEGALATIERASHEALEELRAILGVLRDTSGADVPLEPSPGLADIGTLVELARNGGSEIGLQVGGEEPELVPDAVQLAAFRIVQESLTNIRRHAPGGRAQVTLAYTPKCLRVTIENSTSDGPIDAGGSGITGMRERAVALGGTLDAGINGGLFRVAAELPYRLSP